MKTLIFTATVAAALAMGASAQANSFTNGDFSANTGVGQVDYNTTVTGWYVPGGGYSFLYQNGAADTTAANGQYGYNGLWGANNGGNNVIANSPSGSQYFIAQDGAFQQAPLNQDISGLTIGKTYTVGFNYGYAQQYGFSGDTLQNWAVSLGNSASQVTPTLTNPDHGFTGWFHDSFQFVANASTETLSFAAYGNLPVPPFAVLDGVTFSQETVGVPEPASWAMMLIGVTGLGAMVRRRRATGVVAA